MKLSIILVGAVTVGGCATTNDSRTVAPATDVAHADPQANVERSSSQSDVAHEQTIVDEGLRLYAEQNYVEAARAFEQAYSAEPEPSLLFARAQALRLAGVCEEAKPLYEAFLRDAPEPTYGTVVRHLSQDCQ